MLVANYWAVVLVIAPQLAGFGAGATNKLPIPVSCWCILSLHQHLLVLEVGTIKLCKLLVHVVITPNGWLWWLFVVG